jgi:hypothetical protein
MFVPMSLGVGRVSFHRLSFYLFFVSLNGYNIIFCDRRENKIITTWPFWLIFEKKKTRSNVGVTGWLTEHFMRQNVIAII